MKTIHKILAVLLAAAVLLPAAALPARAAAPSVETDEAMYVNLDVYGKPEKINVVKGCSLNGNSSFTDYGSYDSVTNMSNGAAPQLTGDGVSWKLPEGTGRFYYDCTPKAGTVALPWTFDVSYKLNGVPTAAEKLAGASGTVEVDIHAVPNRGAADYYRNNFLLQAGMEFDLSDTLSVEAPGAQVQSVGSRKVVLFAALPGEEKTFAIRVGTRKFKTDGVILMMVPGTLSQMDDVKDIRDAKDTVKDSADAISDGTDAILGTIESMTGGLQQARAGLVSLDRARGKASAARGGLYDDADEGLADLSSLAEQTKAMAPHLQSAQKMVGEINADLNALSSTATEAKPYLSSLVSSIGRLRSEADDLRDLIDDVQSESGRRDTLIRAMKADLSEAEQSLAGLKALLGNLSGSLSSLSDVMGQISALADQAAQSGDFTAAVLAALLPELQDTVDATNALIAAATGTSSSPGLLDLADSCLDTAGDTVSLADSYFGELDDGLDSADQILKYSSRIGGTVQNLLRLSGTLIDDAAALNRTLDSYEGEINGTLKDAEELTTRLADTMDSSNRFLSDFNAMMKSGDGSLDAGTRDSLAGMIDVLEKSLEGIGKTSVIRNANDTIRQTVDRETDKYENDSNVLNLDAEAVPISFTSLKNPAPSSLQIILRTDEIGADSGEATPKDPETAKQDIGPFARMRNVFLKIWQSIVSAFQNR